MRIVKRGQLPGDKQQEITCQNCKSEIEIANSELTYASQYNESFYYFQCPVCGHQVNCQLVK